MISESSCHTLKSRLSMSFSWHSKKQLGWSTIIGNIPLKWFLAKDMCSAFVSLLRHWGIFPLKLLLYRTNVLRDVRLPIDSGNSPSISVPSILKVSRDFRLPMLSGNRPLNRQLINSKYFKLVHCVNSSGKTDDVDRLCMISVSRLDNCDIPERLPSRSQ